MTPTKRFVTLFPLSENVHLLKDVGMIPYILHRDYQYESILVTYKNSEQYPALEHEVKGLKIHYLKGKKTAKLPLFNYIINNAKHIDILNIYHLSVTGMCCGILLKIFHPKALLYYKLDINNHRFVQNLTSFKRFIYQQFFHIFPDIISYELENSGEIMKHYFPTIPKFIKIANGIDPQEQSALTHKRFEEKDNLIITVGRIGAPEKNHELLLNALKSVNMQDWKVVFIGPVEKEFNKKIKLFFQQHPDKKDKLIFTGEITSKKELFNWYNKAKIFCLTSIWECFPLVFPEALYWGNYIITSEIQAAQEITLHETIGSIIHTEIDLTQELQKIIDGTKDIANCYTSICQYGKQFLWTDILKPLNERLKSLAK